MVLVLCVLGVQRTYEFCENLQIEPTIKVNCVASLNIFVFYFGPDLILEFRHSYTGCDERFSFLHFLLPLSSFICFLSFLLNRRKKCQTQLRQTLQGWPNQMAPSKVNFSSKTNRRWSDALVTIIPSTEITVSS